jgi:hypothetical protein
VLLQLRGNNPTSKSLFLVCDEGRMFNEGLMLFALQKDEENEGFWRVAKWDPEFDQEAEIWKSDDEKVISFF